MVREDAWETIFRALEDEDRRRVLVALLERSDADDAVRVPEDLPGGNGEDEAVRRNLYHRHLPVLEDAGYVRWDRSADAVRRGDSFDEIRPVLRLLHDAREDLPDGWI